MFKKLSNRFSPSAIDFEAMRSSAQFSRQPQRLREEVNDDLPPEPSAPPAIDTAESELEVLESRQAKQREETESETVSHAPTESEKVKKMALQIKMKKSQARTQSLKDLEHQLKGIKAAFEDVENPSLVRQILGCHLQFTAPYGGRTALKENEGMGVIRPYLLKQTQKLDCLKLNKETTFEKIKNSEAKVLEKIKQFKGLPMPEKAQLFRLSQLLNAVLTLLFETQRTEENPVETPELSEELPADAHQVKSALFQLKAKVKTVSEDEKADFIKQIKRHEQDLKAHQCAERMQAMQRSGRTIKLYTDRLKNCEKKLEMAKTTGACQMLQRESKQLTRLLNKEAQGITRFYSKSFSGRHPSAQLLQSKVSLLSRLHTPDFDIFLTKQDAKDASLIQWLQESELPESENSQIMQLDQILLQACVDLNSLLQKSTDKLYWSSAKTRLDELESLEKHFDDLDLEIEDLETQFLESDSESETQFLLDINQRHFDKLERYNQLTPMVKPAEGDK